MASKPWSSPSSLSSPIVGTVGRERPAVRGAVVSGVFWGVGATPSAPLDPIGTEDVPLILPGLFFVALLSGSSDERENEAENDPSLVLGSEPQSGPNNKHWAKQARVVWSDVRDANFVYVFYAS